MKKILTFLVMLFATVSILSAQNAKFNYQAVVRDVNNYHNLVMNTEVEVSIAIIQLNAAGDPINTMYETTLTGKTNRNGMFAAVIGPSDKLDSVDWSMARIDATFKANGTLLSKVETPVMAVPYALQAKTAPLAITTKAVCDYLQNADTDGKDVDSIYKALVANPSFGQAMKDSAINYVKTQYPVIRNLAIYFLSTVTPQDLADAYDQVSDPVKDTVKKMIVKYLKSAEGKQNAYDVLAYYLQNTTKDDVKDLINEARSNQQASDIEKMLYDSAVSYIKANRDLFEDIAKDFIATVIDSQDVVNFHEYLKTVNNGSIYDYMLTKFDNYLNHYLYDVYYAVSNKQCPTVTVCGLQDQIDQLKLVATAIANKCPRIVSATITVNPTPNNGYDFSATLENVTTNAVLNVKNAAGSNVLPTTNNNWTKSEDTWTISGFDKDINPGQTLTFSLEVQKDGCPAVNTMNAVVP